MIWWLTSRNVIVPVTDSVDRRVAKVSAVVPLPNVAAVVENARVTNVGVVAMIILIKDQGQWSAVLRGGWLQGEIDRLGPHGIT